MIMQKSPKNTRTSKIIAILLIDRFSNLCLSNAIEPMRAANGFASSPIYNWAFYSLDGAPVRSSSDLTILPDGAIGDMDQADRLYVISSYGHIEKDTSRMRRAIRSAARRSQSVFGLDTGAWLLASAGVLKGRNATIHWDILDAFAERLRQEAGGEPENQIRRAYALCYGREPSGKEIADCTDLIAQHSLTSLCRVLMNTSELIYVR